ncbi:putative RNA methyltransferase At5g51130 [Morella rubra]|uniref:RNA methyltransferase n=1 Tax=Morella rubra TaxID=262757 RepID=A0A6A1UJZ2_9ROSI|nr:putative RNA methyltransferase At5g51130 [Morella rubra]
MEEKRKEKEKEEEEAAGAEKEMKQPRKRKRKEIGQDLKEDPRLKVLKKEWFEDKDCLDIGCNSGIMTILIAKNFHCRSILGIDIDSNRIEDAYWHLKKFVRMAHAQKMHLKASKLEVSRSADAMELSVTASPSKETKEISSPLMERDLFGRVSFQQENFVQSRWQPEKHYDTILCLSVTKWVHLNWGDEGLITLFSKVWRLLLPGGVFVLEPQPWKSYENNRLVSEIGFRRVEDVTCSLSGSKTGFNRPILQGSFENLDDTCSGGLTQTVAICRALLLRDVISISLASMLQKAMISMEGVVVQNIDVASQCPA